MLRLLHLRTFAEFQRQNKHDSPLQIVSCFGLVKEHQYFGLAKRSISRTACKYHNTDRTRITPVSHAITHHSDIWVFSKTRLAQNGEVLVKMGNLVKGQCPNTLPSQPHSWGRGEGRRGARMGDRVGQEPEVQHGPGRGRGRCLHFRQVAGEKTSSK